MFEYKLIIRKSFNSDVSKTFAMDEERWLNEMGKEGWELISVDDASNYYEQLFRFKRKIKKI